MTFSFLPSTGHLVVSTPPKWSIKRKNARISQTPPVLDRLSAGRRQCMLSSLCRHAAVFRRSGWLQTGFHLACKEIIYVRIFPKKWHQSITDSFLTLSSTLASLIDCSKSGSSRASFNFFSYTARIRGMLSGFSASSVVHRRKQTLELIALSFELSLEI